MDPPPFSFQAELGRVPHAGLLDAFGAVVAQALFELAILLQRERADK